VKKIALAALAAALATTARAQGVTVKLGTMAPQGSTWHELLKEMSQRWEEASGGQVKLRIYPGGAQGSEGDMVRKMGINQLQAASISNIGMHDVIPEPTMFSVPLLFDDEQQLDCAFEKVRPTIEAALDRRGFVALQWSRVGAVHMFCTESRPTPATMKGAKIWAWEGDPKSVESMRAVGLNPVVLSSTDTYASLQTGMIDCVPNVPLYILTTRLFEKAHYMTSVAWSYVVGATIVRKDAWEKIAPDLRPKLLAIARELGERVDAEVKKLNADAVSAMQKQGLTVVPGEVSSWRPTLEKTYPVLRGGSVPAPFFDQVIAARDGCGKAARK